MFLATLYLKSNRGMEDTQGKGDQFTYPLRINQGATAKYVMR